MRKKTIITAEAIEFRKKFNRSQPINVTDARTQRYFNQLGEGEEPTMEGLFKFACQERILYYGM